MTDLRKQVEGLALALKVAKEFMAHKDTCELLETSWGNPASDFCNCHFSKAMRQVNAALAEPVEAGAGQRESFTVESMPDPLHRTIASGMAHTMREEPPAEQVQNPSNLIYTRCGVCKGLFEHIAEHLETHLPAGG